MRIGIDLSITKINQAGTAIYTKSLYDSLSRLDTANRYIPFSVNQRREMIDPKSLRTRFDTIYRDIFWTNFILPYKLSRQNLDLVHFPANIIPLYSPNPTVVTILDAILFLFPENFPIWQRNLFKTFVPLAAHRSNKIITISEQSRNDIIKLFNIEPEKISVTYLAASPKFRVLSVKEISEVKSKYDIENFILTVGAIEPRKNIKRLIQAFAKVHSDFPSLCLVHAGPRGWMSEDILLDVDKCGVRDFVKFLGRVPIDDLVALYNAAEVFVYPSLYEGFGLPVLEAMSCGCPVVTSKTSSLPEIVGDAAILIDPINVDELAEDIQTILEDHELHRSLGSKGLERAKKFSWEKCAQETIYVYNQAVNT